MLSWPLVFGLLCCAAVALAQGGPPLRTDDPGTPGNANWEINFAAAVERRAKEREYEAPLLDINYGLGERIQLKYELPYIIRGEEGAPTRTGLGNSLFGVKWRFYQSKTHDVALATYPQMEVNNPTHSADRGLVERGVRFLLPVEIAKNFGPVDVNIEAGHRFSQHAPGEWIAGVALGHEASRRLELLGELYGIRASGGGTHETTFDGGGRFKLGGPLLLLFMAGRSVHRARDADPRFIGYLGIQFQLAHRHEQASACHSK
ncbi:MAG: hypothetical protein ACE14M_13295 [Terriglobales bacterium]